jgi:hypothetical protein
MNRWPQNASEIDAMTKRIQLHDRDEYLTTMQRVRELLLALALAALVLIVLGVSEMVESWI